MLRHVRVTFRQPIPVLLAAGLFLTLMAAGCEKRIREPGSFNRPAAPLTSDSPAAAESAVESTPEQAD